MNVEGIKSRSRQIVELLEVSVDRSKHLKKQKRKKEKKPVVRNYSSMCLVQGECVRTLITCALHLGIYTFVALILNITKHFLI